jgi:hypothetical protein
LVRDRPLLVFVLLRFEAVVDRFADALFVPSDFELDAADFAAVDFAAVFVSDDLAALDFAALDLAALDDLLALDDFAGAFDVAAFEVVLFGELEVERLRLEPFESFPMGRALLTAFTAPVATSPTVPAILPAVLPTVFPVWPAVFPTCLTTLPGSGMRALPSSAH